MPEPDYYLRQGDANVDINAVLTDADGDAVDVTGASVVFKMRALSGTTSIVNAGATIDGAVGGSVHYTFGTADTASSGVYLAEWEVTFPGAVVQTYPNDAYTLLLISEQLP